MAVYWRLPKQEGSTFPGNFPGVKLKNTDCWTALGAFSFISMGFTSIEQKEENLHGEDGRDPPF